MTDLAAPVLHAPPLCPECMQPFKSKQWRALFCCPQHRADWNNRQTVRGRVLTPFDMVERITRGGTRGTPEARLTGKRAATDRHRLIQKWRDEDREAGRMAWVDYLGARYRLGYDLEL